jgi:pimeloyl-ACP methyl ester carboxylesterase
VGTQGLGDQCAPSKQLAAGSEYEGLFIQGLVARGYGVVVPDYQGLGTEGLHTYINREVTGNAVLDAVRAAQRLPEANLPDNGRVGITGYSQGGGAAAAAGELAPTYAPELNLKGVVAGATPGDLPTVANNLDGSLYFAFLGYSIAALAEGYDLDLTPYLNERGLDTLQTLSGQCTIESVLSFPFTRGADLTVDGRSVPQLIQTEPFATIVAEQLIGNGRKPTAPTLVTHSLLDDVVPYAAGRNLARRWCAQGAKVQLATNIVPTHVGGALASYPASFLFLENRFAGRPFANGCWLI